MGFKHTVCVDFDGVLHSYASGWKGIGQIPDPPVPGAMAWLVEAVNDDRLEICVYSSRSKELAGVHAMQDWLRRHLTSHFRDAECYDHENARVLAERVLQRLSFPTQKPAANMTIDDRAFCFGGRFPPIEWIVNFKPWNKRGQAEAEDLGTRIRMEDGTVQFGDDWPGVFLRGDSAGPLGHFLQHLIDGIRSGREISPIALIQVECYAEILRACEAGEGQRKTVLRDFRECRPLAKALGEREPPSDDEIRDLTPEDAADFLRREGWIVIGPSDGGDPNREESPEARRLVEKAAAALRETAPEPVCDRESGVRDAAKALTRYVARLAGLPSPNFDTHPDPIEFACDTSHLPKPAVELPAEWGMPDNPIAPDTKVSDLEGEPDEHQRLADAVCSFLDGIGSEFAGDLPTAMEALAKLASDEGWMGNNEPAVDKMREALQAVSRWRIV